MNRIVPKDKVTVPNRHSLLDSMTTTSNAHFTDDDDDHPTVSSKRSITLSSDDEAGKSTTNYFSKRPRASSVTKIKPSQSMNKPAVRNTRQTSLSIIKTSTDGTSSGEGKWNLKMMPAAPSESTSKQPKKKLTPTVGHVRMSCTNNGVVLEIHRAVEVDTHESIHSNGLLSFVDQRGEDQ